MSYSIEPAYLFHNELAGLLFKASINPINKWFFADGCFSAESDLERSPNTWLHENCVVIENREIVAYCESYWSKPLNRGCKAVNWLVAEKNYHAHRIYEKFIHHYFGHNVGKRHNGQMAYNGEISDVFLYEVTDEEYFKWKKKNNLLQQHRMVKNESFTTQQKSIKNCCFQ